MRIYFHGRCAHLEHRSNTDVIIGHINPRQKLIPKINMQVPYRTYTIQWSLCFKTTHGTKKMWSYIAGGLKIKVN